MTDFEKKRLWAVMVGTTKLHGIAATDVAAFADASSALESLVGDRPVIFRRGSERHAVEVARELRAAARDRRLSSETGSQLVEYVYRHHQKYDWDSVDIHVDIESFLRAGGAKYTWETEKARVLRKTTKRLFIEDKSNSYTTLDGHIVQRTFAIDRVQFERDGRSRYGWTTDPHPPASGETGERNWWTEALGITLPSTYAKVKTAFRRAAAKSHPDAGGSSEDFRRIAEAFEAAKQHFGATT